MSVGGLKLSLEGTKFPLHTPLDMAGLSHDAIASKGICVALIRVVQFNSGQASASPSSSLASWPPLIRRWLKSSHYATHFSIRSLSPHSKNNHSAGVQDPACIFQ